MKVDSLKSRERKRWEKSEKRLERKRKVEKADKCRGKEKQRGGRREKKKVTKLGTEREEGKQQIREAGLIQHSQIKNNYRVSVMLTAH